MKHKSTKRALVLSGLALLICVSMLLGTTFAWFTDSVTSAGNIIKSGTLNIDLLVKGGNTGYTDYTSVKADHKPVFDYDKWEPGYTLWANVKVVTTGDLALKYTLRFLGEGLATAKLAEVIDVYYAPAEVAQPAARPDLSAVAGLTRIGTLKEVFTQGAGVIIDDELIPETNDTDYATIILHMQEAAGNEYQNRTISAFDLQILATQYTYEGDSFDDQYDVNAVFPEVTVVTVPAGGAASTVSAGGVTVALPANTGTEAHVYTLDVSDTDTTTDPSTNETSVEFDATLYLDGNRVTSDNNDTIYTLTLTIPTGANISSVTHNGTALTNANTGADQTYTYDPATGVLTIYTKSFSPFAVTYSIAVTGLTLSAESASMNPNDTLQLTATVAPENATQKAVTWASSDEAVATVSASGLVTAVAGGNATITATAGGVSATCEVSVVPANAIFRLSREGSNDTTYIFDSTLDTLAEASGDYTLVLLKDTTLNLAGTAGTGAFYSYKLAIAGEDVILDLNGHTLSFNLNPWDDYGSFYLMAYDCSSLTIRNGTIENKNPGVGTYALFYSWEGTVTIENNVTLVRVYNNKA